jgi:hypothetical protein
MVSKGQMGRQNIYSDTKMLAPASSFTTYVRRELVCMWLRYADYGERRQ